MFNMNYLVLGLYLLSSSVCGIDIRPVDRNVRSVSGVEEDVLLWLTRQKRTPAVWGAPVPDYSNLQITGPTVYLYTILFIDLKTSEHYSNDMSKASIEIVKLVRESNKYFYQLNIRIVIVDILPTYRNDLSLYSFEDFHNSHTSSLPYHNFAVLISFRYAGGLAFVSGFCSNKNVMMVGFYPHNPQAMASIFFHETMHLIGVSHTHSNETLDVPNCPCNPVSFVPKSSSQLVNQTAESLLSSTTHHTEGCLKIPGFDHNCTAQLAVNLLHRSRCLSNVHRSPALNRAEGYHTEPKAQANLLSICGNGVVEAGEQCDCGLSYYCRELNCEASTCEHKVPIWILAISVIGFLFVLFASLFLYCRSKLRHSKKQYSAVHTKMLNGTTTQSDYLATIGQLANQLSRILISIKSLLCKRNPARTQESTHIPTKTKLDTSSIIIVRSAQQLPSNRPVTRLERPKIAPPLPPLLSNQDRPKILPPRPPQPSILKGYSQLEHKIEYKFADFDDEE